MTLCSIGAIEYYIIDYSTSEFIKSITHFVMRYPLLLSIVSFVIARCHLTTILYLGHPIEDILVNSIPTVIGPLLLSPHVSLLWVYTCMKLYQSIDAHSGYDLPFPFSPWSTIKYMDCSPAHNYHHSHNVGNYGGYFMFWDSLCGTDQSYNRYKLKQRAIAQQGEDK